MKNIFKFIFIITLFIFAQNIFAEEIKKYNVDIELHKDSSMTVTETIYYDFGNIQKHGIFRFIPLYFKVDGQKKMYGLQQRELQFENLSVKRDGILETYTKKKKDENGNYFIKIGKANETITGVHIYEIKYDVLGSLRYFENYDEVYWNAIGLDWNIPIYEVEIHIRGDGITFNEFSCYSGSVGSQNNCDYSIRQDDGSIYFRQQILNPYEGLTISASIDKDIVALQEFFRFTKRALILAIVGIILTIGFTIIRFIRGYQRKYFVYDSIHPRYTPPEDLDAIFTGYLIDKVLHPRDISAGIIQLARDGYITIEKVSEKSFFGNSYGYIFHLKKTIDEINNETNYVNKFMILMLFNNKLDLFSYISTMKKAAKDMNLPNLGIHFYSANSSVTKKIIDVINEMEVKDDTIIRSIKLSDISRSTLQTQVQKINIYLKNIAVNKDFFELRSQKNNKYFLYLFAILFISFIFGQKIFMFIMMFAIFLIAFISTSTRLRYTKKGWETKNAIEGFKLFLEMTEKDRYEFFNNPAESPQEFIEYLPYAIALGIEKKWAKQFEGITIPRPQWYGGAGPFTAAGFTNEILSFSKSVTSSVASKTSSGSGSHGGGSSGGGSGGGGGGSW